MSSQEYKDQTLGGDLKEPLLNNQSMGKSKPWSMSTKEIDTRGNTC
jgi:hypothetical protein